MRGLVWLRNDLRIDDNPALRQACIDTNEVHCIYIYSSEQIKLHNEANCKVEFIISNLLDLSESLKKINQLRNNYLYESKKIDFCLMNLK